MWIALFALALILPAAVALAGLRTSLNRQPPHDADLPFGGM
jgi:hypothetical protein